MYKPVTAEEVVQALAIVESGSNPDVVLGDGGYAMGRWQIHPIWLAEMLDAEWRGGNGRPWMLLRGSWDAAFRCILGRWVQARLTDSMEPLSVALWFHTGQRGVRDNPYAERFSEALATVLAKR